MKKHKLIIGAVSACLISALATGTLAYFTASDTATNLFLTSSTADPDNPDDLFQIAVEEPDPDPSDPDEPGDEYGDPDDPDAPHGREYKDILPSQRFSKQPVVINQGAYDAYVRVQVTFDKTDVWADSGDYENGVAIAADGLRGMLGNMSGDAFAAGANAGWTLEGTPAVDAQAKTVTFTYLYNKVLKEGETTAPVFTKVLIPASLDRQQLAALNGFKITVEGEAIQALNTNGDAAPDSLEAARNAFSLYDAQMAASNAPDAPTE